MNDKASDGTQRQQLPHFIFPRSVFLSHRGFSISLKDVVFLRIPLHRAHDSFNDWSLSSWLWWKESEGGE